MDDDFSRNLAPCYDLNFCSGPSAAHQMDVEGEGRHPERADPLRMVASNSLDAGLAADATVRMHAVAAGIGKAASARFRRA